MSDQLVSVLKNGGTAVLATDTIYGVVGSAHSEEVIRRLYELKGRDEIKPFIILIPTIETVEVFGVVLDRRIREILSKVWPGPVTVILPVREEDTDRLRYLHRGTNSLAFRMPAKKSLHELLQVVGPIAAPSANPQGMPPAATIAEAQKYFGDRVDHYEDEGTLIGEPSTIISISNGGVEILHQGNVSMDKI